MSILYEFILILLALVALPKTLYHIVLGKKYRASLLQRFGFGFPEIVKGKRQLIWIHAISMGETQAVAKLAKRLKSSDTIVVISSSTETGHEEAKKSIPDADYHIYFPLDFGWVVKPILRRIRPDLVILCETDFWYNFLKTAKEVGARVVLVNGKLSETSARRFRRLLLLSKALFSKIDRFCLQSERFRERFEQLGVPPEKITITGNLKLDGVYPREETWTKPQDPVLVIGSTHDPEEKHLITVLLKVWERVPRLKVILAPRHPERFDEVAQLLKEKGIPFSCFSKGKPFEEKVFLLDVMGQLRRSYQLADIAIVGGSFFPGVGGHNILEPCCYGVPVLFGPVMHSQLDLVVLVKEYKAGKQVDMDKLSDIIVKLLENPQQRKTLGEGGLRIQQETQGVTERTLNAIIRH